MRWSRPAVDDVCEPPRFRDSDSNNQPSAQRPTGAGNHQPNMQRGGPTERRAAPAAPPDHGPSSATTFARTSSCASSSPRNARGSAQRPCMAFRIDAGQAGAKETESATRLAVSVARLGKRDASYRYKRSTVTVRAGRSAVWVVWLNVLPPFAIRGPGDTEPRLWQDEEGRWRVSGDAENCPDLPDYERFCAAANAGKVGPEPVLVSRLWCPR